MQILILWLLNPLQIYKHSPTKLVWLVRKLLLTESFTIQHIATTKDRVPFIVLSPYAVLPVRAYKRGARLQRTGRCLLYRDYFRKTKTSDFFGQKYGGFASKVRRFYAKKSDVSVLPKDEIQRTHSPPTKIFFCWNLLHFLHPVWKTPIKPGNLGWRIGCRIPSTM